jgi:transcriptional regulator with XRE-family HTH domain
MRADPFKLMRWMNARKLTPEQLAEESGVPASLIIALLSDDPPGIQADVAGQIAAALQVQWVRLAATESTGTAVIVRTAAELRATKRTIRRDGIAFYNYYSMAAPTDQVGPVVLDILCPNGRIPALNNGHLEPAITVNLGPGDIHGRWAKELTPQTWQRLRANQASDRWITGDSYVEPCYCPHSYSLASDTPARIVSYTGNSNLTALIEAVNDWSEVGFEAFLGWLDRFDHDGDIHPTGLDISLGAGRDAGRAADPGTLLDLLLARRGYTRRTAAGRAGLSLADLDAVLEDPVTGVGVLRVLARALGIDYRVLLPTARAHDAVGKSVMSLDQAKDTIRDFGPYRVASMAGAPHLTDLTGLFLLVGEGSEASAEGNPADGYLAEPADSHYLVLSGSPVIEWCGPGSEEGGWATLSADASVWVAPFVRHRWLGWGSLLKFGSGTHVGYLDLLELTNAYAPAATLRRSYRDRGGWGYQADLRPADSR